MSTRDKIKSNRLAVVELSLSTGTVVHVRAFSGPGRRAYSAYVDGAKDNGGVSSEAVAAMALCEEDGSLSYDWQNAEDLAELAAHIDATYLDAISIKIFEISGLSKKAVEEAEKN